MRAFQRSLQSWEFVPPDDQKLPESERTTFVLSPLSQLERMEAWDNLNWVSNDPDGSSTIKPRAFQQAFQLCLSHIVEIRNFPAGNGEQPKPWPPTRTERAQYLEQFSDLDILMIGSEIRNHSALEERAKNS
jgi:hypothetical protein